ncbi:L domain-like protein [Meira miltonrushii]|uniref:L domain-like protein n=1 Tax=Meira miltonrushii TaxID=1280837 RepID=A0A316VCK5_9BASI|nr:L domain-like protein [Meira miltonrushii]PWN33721.1 L domain-like protein [Meira miltonrushii]
MVGQHGETSRSGAQRGRSGPSRNRNGGNAANDRREQDKQSTTAKAAKEVEEEEEEDVVTERARLDISGNPLPPVEGLIEAFSQLNNLQRLDMSDMKASEENDNPNGLETLQWMSRAVAKSRSRSKNSSSVFGQQLTWLKFSGNPSLGEHAGKDAWEGLDQFSKLTVLNASSCDLPVPPPSSTLLAWQSLGALVLGHNAIDSIPHFPSMPQLNTIVLSHNQITSLPRDMPANLPGLKKLSITHNKLQWTKNESPLPDFSLCSHLREVRISGNIELKRLPNHISGWGKGVGKDSKGTGLETFEAGDCGLEDWTSIAPLMQANEDTQNGNVAETNDAIHPSRKRRVRGLITLSLRGNEVTKAEDYREKVLEAHPALRVLDSVKLQVDKKKEDESSTEVHNEETKVERDSGAKASKDVESHRYKATQNRQSVPLAKAREDALQPSTGPKGARPQHVKRGEEKESAGEYSQRDASSTNRQPRGQDRNMAKDRKVPEKTKAHDHTAEAEEASRKKPHKRGGRGKKKKSAEEADEEASNSIKDPFLRSVEKSEKGKADEEDEQMARIRARAGPSVSDVPKKPKKKDNKARNDTANIAKDKKTDASTKPSSLEPEKTKKRKAWDEDAGTVETSEQNMPSKKGKIEEKDVNKKQPLKADQAPKEVTSVAGVVNVAKKRNGEEKRKAKVPFNVAKKPDSKIGWGGPGKTSEPSIGLGGAWS